MYIDRYRYKFKDTYLFKEREREEGQRRERIPNRLSSEPGARGQGIQPSPDHDLSPDRESSAQPTKPPRPPNTDINLITGIKERGKICFKELAPAIAEGGESRISRVCPQGGDLGVFMLQLESEDSLDVEFPLLWEPHLFSLEVFYWLDDAHLHYGWSSALIKVISFNVNLILKSTFTETSRLVFNQVSGYCGLAKLTPKI